MQVKNEKSAFSRKEFLAAIKLSRFHSVTNVASALGVTRRSVQWAIVGKSVKLQQKLIDLLEPYLVEVKLANQRAENILESLSEASPIIPSSQISLSKGEQKRVSTSKDLNS